MEVPLDSYLANMRTPGTYGGNIELTAYSKMTSRYVPRVPGPIYFRPIYSVPFYFAEPSRSFNPVTFSSFVPRTSPPRPRPNANVNERP